MPTTEKYFIGVDVGTGSARAALVSVHGKVIRTCVRQIKTWRPQSDHYEQSSDDIWNAVCICIQVNKYNCKLRTYITVVIINIKFTLF